MPTADHPRRSGRARRDAGAPCGRPPAPGADRQGATRASDLRASRPWSGGAVRARLLVPRGDQLWAGARAEVAPDAHSRSRGHAAQTSCVRGRRSHVVPSAHSRSPALPPRARSGRGAGRRADGRWRRELVRRGPTRASRPPRDQAVVRGAPYGRGCSQPRADRLWTGARAEAARDAHSRSQGPVSEISCVRGGARTWSRLPTADHPRRPWAIRSRCRAPCGRPPAGPRTSAVCRQRLVPRPDQHTGGGTGRSPNATASRVRPSSASASSGGSSPSSSSTASPCTADQATASA